MVMKPLKTFSNAQIIGLRTLYFASWGATLLILLTAILAKVTKKKLDRYATWYLFFAGWTVSGISQTLLPLAGLKIFEAPSPSLCFAQGVLTYSASTLTTFTTFALVLQTWLHVRSVTGPINSVTVATLIVVPLLLWGVLTVEMLVFGLKHESLPTQWSVDGRCVIAESKMLTTQSLVLGCIGALGILITQGAISFHVWKDRRAFKEHAFSVVRVGVFCSLVACAFGLQLAVLIKKSIIGAYELRIVVALVSLFAPLIFGTQMDLIRVWMFWKKEKPDTISQRFTLHPAQAGWKFDPEQDYRERQDDSSVGSFPDRNLITRYGHS